MVENLAVLIETSAKGSKMVNVVVCGTAGYQKTVEVCKHEVETSCNLAAESLKRLGSVPQSEWHLYEFGEPKMRCNSGV